MSRTPRHTLDTYTAGILRGDRVLLSQAITLVESRLPEDRPLAEALLQQLAPYRSVGFRLGISGPPGVGKSTLIEQLGLHVAASGAKLAILTIDPSSQRSLGSILGDKTRMEQLSQAPGVYIRPSPAGSVLGGVAARTREVLWLCQAAGFDQLWVETVGVGQNETQVQQMVDCFLLLAQPGAGDEMQGIKRGVMELANLVVVNKADGPQLALARQTREQIAQALQLFPAHASGVAPEVLLVSALSGEGLPVLWQWLQHYDAQIRASGYRDQLRRAQMQQWFDEAIQDLLRLRLTQHPDYPRLHHQALQALDDNALPGPTAAALMAALWPQA